MLDSMFPAVRRCAIGLLAVATALAASAQAPPGKAAQAGAGGDVALSTDLVKTGLYLIKGGGGNTLMRFSAHGVILVDGKLPGKYRALTSQVRKINRLGDLPTRILILTDHHEDHAGNYAQFLAAGVAVIVQENARRRLPVHQAAEGKTAPPIIAFDRDYTLRVGGVEARLIHFGNARSDGDAVVLFTDLKVIAVGDLFAAGMPDPDYSAGGSLVGWGPVLARILELDFDVVVPSAGPTVNRAELQAFKTKIDTLVSRAKQLVTNGVAKDQLMAKLKTEDLGWNLAFTGAQLDGFHAELSAGN